MRSFGENIGWAFQVVDDILDQEESSAALGKTAGKDQAQQKATYPALYGLEKSREIAADLESKALRELDYVWRTRRAVAPARRISSGAPFVTLEFPAIALMKEKKTFHVDSVNARRRPKPGKARLDVLIVERGLAPSRERAQALLLAGQIRVNGAPAEKPGTQVATDAQIELSGETLRYASRGGLKLEGALEDFGVTPENKVCLDAGSSTGGFTDCLLQHGAQKVYAVDVTIDQLDWKLRQDNRVVTIEKNARYLQPENVGEPVSFVTMDVSFISVTKVLPAIVPIAAP